MLVKEKIILSNSFNEAEFLRCISKNGFDTLGVRVSNDIDLCSYILMKNGKKMSGTYINDKEADFIYFSFLGGVLNDSSNIRSAIDSFRDCVIGDALDEMNDYLSADFSKKKEVIINAYKKYIGYKKDNNLYDKHDMINFIIEKKLKVSDIDVEYFKEFDITKLMSEMINNVFDHVKKISIKDYFKNENNHKEIIKAYGKVNEIDYIFNKINDEKIKIDECQIVLLDNSYLTEVLTYAKKYNIPYTSTIGIPFIETNVGKLLKALIDLNNQGYGVDAYKRLFSNDAFNFSIIEKIFTRDGLFKVSKYDNFVKYAGWLRLRFYDDVDVKNIYNDYLVYNTLVTLKNDLKQGIMYFINKYVKDDLEKDNALNKINDILELKKKYNADIDDFKLLESLLSSNTNQSVSNSGMLHISGLDKAFSSIRKYNFIVGLDNDFPGNPKENYLIYDDEYAKTKSDIYLSVNIITNKINKAKTFIELCSNVYLIYSFYNLVDLKDKNPSSIIYDELANRVKISTYSYEKSNLLENKKIIRAKSNNKVAIVRKTDWSDVKLDSKTLLNKTYSASKIHLFFDNRFAFIFECFLGISLDSEDNMYTALPGNEKGNIIHKLMENFDKNRKTKQELLDEADKLFKQFMEKRPPVITAQANKDYQVLIKDVENAYDMDLGNECIKSEHPFYDKKVGNIYINGTVDRIEKARNGEYIIVDYKTGNYIEHENDDVKSCIQGLIYAYFVEEELGINVSKIEFRYTHFKETRHIDYDPVTKQEMIDCIKEIEDAIRNNEFNSINESQFNDKYKKLLSLYEEVNR